jgi:hypothetical protein
LRGRREEDERLLEQEGDPEPGIRDQRDRVVRREVTVEKIREHRVRGVAEHLFEGLPAATAELASAAGIERAPEEMHPLCNVSSPR